MNIRGRGLVVILLITFALCRVFCATAAVKVAVYKPSSLIEDGLECRSDAILAALLDAEGIDATLVSTADEKSLASYDVFIIPQESGSHAIVGAKKAFLRKWVEAGHGLMTTHDAVGYRGHAAVIPEIAEGTGNYFSDHEPYKNRCCVSVEHPVTKDMPRKSVFTTAYYDFISLRPGPKGLVVVRGAAQLGDRLFSSVPAVVAGELGKGRYVACGILLGGIAPKALPIKPEGAELDLLLNSVRYLAGESDRRSGSEQVVREIGPSTFLAKVEIEEDEEIIEGITVGKLLESCQIPVKAKWRKSRGEAPVFTRIPDGTPVLSEAERERICSMPEYYPWPESWQVISLSGTWKFKELPDTEDNPENDEGTSSGYWKPGFGDQDWAEIEVPIVFIPDQDNPHVPHAFHGVQWYRRRVDVPNAEDRRFVLCFEGVDRELTAYVNGRKVGRNLGVGYAFEFDVTDAVKPGGENVIALRVYDALERRSSRQPLNGLYDRVSLQVRPEVYAQQVLVDPIVDESALALRATLVNGTGKAGTFPLVAHVESYTNMSDNVEGKRTAHSVDLGSVDLQPGTNNVELKIKLENPVFWSPENPFLYVLHLKSADMELARERFGYREFKAEDHFFYLNGRRVYLRGVLLNTDVMPSPISPWLHEDPNHTVERFLACFKSMNCNMVLPQGLSYYMPRHFYDRCDEIGLMVYDLVPFGFNSRIWTPYKESWDKIWLWARTGEENPKELEINPTYVENAGRHFTGQYNHPCKVMTAVSTENRAPLYFRSHLAVYEALKSIDRQNRPVLATSGGAPSAAAFTFTDCVDYHIYPGWINGHPRDHRSLIVEGNRRAWRYVEKVTPIINWEAGAGIYWVYDDEMDRVRDLWTAETPDKTAIIADIEGKNNPHSRGGLNARWMSLYGIRRTVIDDYEKAREEKRAILAYRQEYMIRNQIESARLAGDLFQGYGMNFGRLGDCFAIKKQGMGLRMRFSDLNLSMDREGLPKTCPILAANGYDPVTRSSNPRLVCIDPIESKNSFAGRTYHATVYAINDTVFDSGAWSIRAVVRDDATGNVMKDLTADIGAVPSAKRKLIPFEWNIPATPDNRSYRLELFLEQEGEVVSDNSYVFHAIGTDAFDNKIGGGNRKTAVYDSAADSGYPLLSTAAVLDDMGVEYRRISDFEKLEDYDVLFIGAASADNTVSRAGELIHDWVEAGGRLVAFEQELPGQVPGISRLSIVKKHGGCVVDMVVPKHPVFKDLQVNDYWNLWNGLLPTAHQYGIEGGIYSALIGPLNEAVVGTGVFATPRATTKAVQMVMADVKLGKGIAFVSQAEATRRYGKDAVATKYLRNVVEYALSDVTNFSTEMASFSITPMDFYDLGYVDLGNAATKHIETARPWQDGMSELGDLRFRIPDSKALEIDEKSAPITFKFPERMRIMFPEHEEQRVLTDVDQGPLNKQIMEALCFLHGAEGAEADETVARYVVRYVDKTELTINVVVGENIGLAEGSKTLTHARAVGSGMYVAQWLNPHSGKKIESVTLRCVHPGARVTVGGITALLMREKIHD